MPFTPINVVNGSTPANATWGNLVQTQFAQALTSINADLIAAGFVLSGYTAAKDGTVANQLDVAAGRAYLVQSDGNNDLGLVAHGATTQTTATASSTYYLDLNPDGTWSWATSHSAVANHLTICTVTTDASGNIATVTDTRNPNITLFSALSGLLGLGGSGNAYADAVGNLTGMALIAKRALSGANQIFQEWIATDGHTWTLSIDTAGDILLADATSGKQWTFGQSGLTVLPGAVYEINGQTTAGSFGVPMIVAQALDTHVTTTGDVTLLTYAVPATGLYEINGYAYFGNTTAEAVTFRAVWTDAHGGTATAYFTCVGGGYSGLILNGSESPLGVAISVPTQPIVVEASSGTNILVHWNDPAGTPNDFVSTLIKRLS